MRCVCNIVCCHDLSLWSIEDDDEDSGGDDDEDDIDLLSDDKDDGGDNDAFNEDDVKDDDEDNDDDDNHDVSRQMPLWWLGGMGIVCQRKSAENQKGDWRLIILIIIPSSLLSSHHHYYLLIISTIILSSALSSPKQKSKATLIVQIHPKLAEDSENTLGRGYLVITEINPAFSSFNSKVL